jgi:hypothetical protein
VFLQDFRKSNFQSSSLKKIPFVLHLPAIWFVFYSILLQTMVTALALGMYDCAAVPRVGL